MRRQLPVYSPLSVRAVGRAARRGLREDDGAAEPPLPRLRRRLEERLLVPPEQVVLTSSGTDALALALQTVQRSGASGSFAVPAYTCWDVGTAVQTAGGTARFYDLDPDTLAPDLGSVEAALAGGCSAVVVSPLFGYPMPWPALRALARDHGASLVEDSAQAHGSRWDEGPPGTAGDLAVLSFGRGKGWTGGGGGALIVCSPGLAAHVPPLPPLVGSSSRSLPRWAVAALGQAVLGRPSLYGLPASLPWLRLGESVYHPPSPPRAMTAFQAALALETEEAADAEAGIRRKTAISLLERIPTSVSTWPVRPGPGGMPGFLRLPVRVAEPSRSWVRAARRLGVRRAYARTLPEVDELSSVRSETLPDGSPPLPGARLLAETLFTAPTHSLVGEQELERIAATVARP